MGKAGFSAERLKRLTAGMADYVARGEVAGVVTLIQRHGEIVHTDVIGWQDEEAKIPLKRDSLFRIASMTKPVVSVAAMMLIEEGKLRFTDPIERWLPEFANPKVLRSPGAALDDCTPASRPITVKDLLIHRSGIAYPITAEGPLAAALREFNSDVLPAIAPDPWLKRLGALPLVFEPGQQWHYGFSTDVLGLMLGRVAGMSFPDLLRTRIFEPLGMKDTFFWVPEDKQERLTVAYTPNPKTGKRIIVDHPSQSRWIDTASFPSGGAGLISTADDYLQFARMFAGNGTLNGVRLISRKTVELMTTDHLSAAERQIPFLGREFWGNQGFGLGLAMADNVTKQDWLGSPGRYGWPGAYGTAWGVDPKEGLISIMMIQLYFGQGNIRPDFETLTYQAIDD